MISLIERNHLSQTFPALRALSPHPQPFSQGEKGVLWCERGDSNPHTFRYQILSLARLPIPPLSRSRENSTALGVARNRVRTPCVNKGKSIHHEVTKTPKNLELAHRFCFGPLCLRAFVV